MSWTDHEQVVEKQPGRGWKGVVRNGRVFFIASVDFQGQFFKLLGVASYFDSGDQSLLDALGFSLRSICISPIVQYSFREVQHNPL